MKTPDIEALRFAAEWLRQYEDDLEGGDVDNKRASDVAEWLDAQAEAQQLRIAAREHGVPVAGLRQILKERTF